MALDPFQTEQLAASEQIERQNKSRSDDERADWLDQFARAVGRNILESLALEFEQHPHYHRYRPSTRIFTGKEIARLLRQAKDRL